MAARFSLIGAAGTEERPHLNLAFDVVLMEVIAPTSIKVTRL